jgi:hypothetical protein
MLVCIIVQPVHQPWPVKKHLKCHDLVTVCAGNIFEADARARCEPSGPLGITGELSELVSSMSEVEVD